MQGWQKLNKTLTFQILVYRQVAIDIEQRIKNHEPMIEDSGSTTEDQEARETGLRIKDSGWKASLG